MFFFPRTVKICTVPLKNNINLTPNSDSGLPLPSEADEAKVRHADTTSIEQAWIKCQKKSQTHLYSEEGGVSRPLRKVPSISAASESMGRTEASAVYRCTVLLGRLLFRKFFMSSRASWSMSSHSEYLSCRSLSCGTTGDMAVRVSHRESVLRFGERPQLNSDDAGRLWKRSSIIVCPALWTGKQI